MGWKDAKCQTLDFEPLDKDVIGYNAIVTTESASAGAAIVQGTGGVWHMWVTEIAKNCGYPSWKTNSMISYASSTSLAGPYAKKDDLFGPFASTPKAVKAPSGEYVLYISAFVDPLSQRVDANADTNVCDCSITHPNKRLYAKMWTWCNETRTDVTEATYMTWTKTPSDLTSYSPFVRIYQPEDHLQTLHAMYSPLILPERKYLISEYRWKCPKNIFRGEPSTYEFFGANIFGTNFMSAKDGLEDPSLYRDPNGVFHAFIVNRIGGYSILHAYSTDFTTWTSTGTAYANSLAFTDNTQGVFPACVRPFAVMDMITGSLKAFTTACAIGVSLAAGTYSS
eukprot:jgi/Bigna1/143123/aug1.76_g17831